MDSEIKRVFLQEKSSNQVHGEPESEEKQDTLQIMNQDTVESVFQDQRRSQLLGKPTMKPNDEKSTNNIVSIVICSADILCLVCIFLRRRRTFSDIICFYIRDFSWNWKEA